MDAPVIEDMLTRLRRGDTLLEYEARLPCKDGSIRYVLVNSNVLWRGDEFLHTRCFTRDVTDRRQEDELARRLADIVENSEDAIIGADLDGLIHSWNPAAERVYGIQPRRPAAQSVRLILPPEREHEERDVVRRVRDGERIPPLDTVRRRKDGSSIPVSLTVSPIRDRAGRIVGASKISRDITDRQRMERELRAVQLPTHDPRIESRPSQTDTRCIS